MSDGAFDFDEIGERTDVVTHKLRQTNPLNLSGQTVFDEVQVAEYAPDISINPTYGLTDYRLVQTTANGGSIAEDSGSFRLRTGTTANGSARLETAEHGEYNSGSMSLAGLLVFVSEAPTGNEDLTWGYYDDSDGFLFGWDATGEYVQRRVGGTDKPKVRKTDWIDPLDGAGSSGATLDWRKPTICRIRMALYGEGPAEIQILAEGPDGAPQYVTVHRFWAEQGELIVHSWGLPVRADSDNGGDSTSIDLHIGGMQFGNIGRRSGKPRVTPETRIEASLSGTTIVPLVSVRKKTAREAINVLAEGYDVISADDLLVLLILDGTLTNASPGSFTNVADAETALEVDTSATAISGGNAIFEKLHKGGNGTNAVLSDADLEQPVPNGVWVTLAARKISGTGGTATVTLRSKERW